MRFGWLCVAEIRRLTDWCAEANLSDDEVVWCAGPGQ